ncbi:MAG: Ig-like domain-containing protein [Abditibacteriota bacterium]|nr:Ig-like domain-containing protein [Abditibacteriota bacterium]
MKKIYLLLAALAVLLSAAAVFGKTIAVNTEADLLALNTGSYVIAQGDTVEFAADKTFDLTGTAWKGIYENSGTIKGNGAVIRLGELSECKYSGNFTDHFTDETYESYFYFGFVFMNEGAIEDLSFVITGDATHTAARGLKRDVPALREGSVVCVRNNGNISGCSVDGGGSTFTVFADNYGAISAFNSCMVTGCSVSGLSLFYPQEEGRQGFIVGYNFKEIEYCFVHDCSIENGYSAGGIVGISKGRVMNCAAWDLTLSSATTSSSLGGIAGDMIYTEFTNCCAFGLDLEGGDTGGIVGYAYHGDLISCYGLCDRNEGNLAGGLFGYAHIADCHNCYLPTLKYPAGRIYQNDFQYEWIDITEFNDGTLLGLLGDGWYRGPGGYPVPFMYGVPVTGVTLAAHSLTLEAGEAVEVQAIIDPGDASEQGLIWSSYDKTIATVDANGVVRGVAPGSTTIRVKTRDGGFTDKCKVKVTISVTGVTLSKTSATLEVGKTLALTAAVVPSDAVNKAVKWTSYDTSIATVDADGKVKAIAPGTTNIKVKTKDGGFTAKCKIKVKEPTVAVTGVTLNKTSAKVETGKTVTLTATIAPEDATNKNVTWQSYDTSIATVDADGVVTGIASGTTNIKVKTKDGGFTAKCKVTVSDPTVAVTGVVLNKTVASVAKGKTFTLKAVVAPTNATNKNVTWQSYDTSIATVTPEGKVKGIAPGTTTIKVKTKDGGFTAKCKVTVVIPVTGVSLDLASVSLKVGKTKTLTATVTPADATLTKVVWTSSNPAVAKVNSSGKITAVKKGKATITATTADGGFTATCAVTVKE